MGTTSAIRTRVGIVMRIATAGPVMAVPVMLVVGGLAMADPVMADLVMVVPVMVGLVMVADGRRISRGVV